MKLNRIEKIFKKDKREHCNYIYSDGENLNWTNGSCILILKDQNLPEMMYRYDSLESRKDTSLTMSSYNFDDILADRTVEIVNIKVDDLKLLYKHTSKDEILTGHVSFENGFAVATNRYTLKKVEIGSMVSNFLVFREDLEYLFKCLTIAKKDGLGGNITLMFGRQYVKLEHSQFTWIGTLTNREFLRWRGIVPKRYAYKAEITNWINYQDVKKLLNDKKIVSILGDKGLLYLKIDAGNNYWIGKSFEDFEIGFNCSFLDLASEGNKKFTMRFNNPLSPVLVNDVMVMPVKL